MVQTPVCRSKEALTVAEWEGRLGLVQDTEGFLWVDVQDENYLAQGIARNLEVHTRWGGFLGSGPGTSEVR